MTEKYGNFINGQYQAGSDAGYYATYDPSSPSTIVGTFVDSSPEHASFACTIANDAFKSWRRETLTTRIKVLTDGIDCLEENLDDLAETMTREQGKPLGESIGEIRKGISESRFAVAEAARNRGYTSPSEKPGGSARTQRVPLGVIAAITPWNFPILTPLRKAVPALAYGNTVVLKPSHLTPKTALRVAELFSKAGLPNGVMNVVTGGKTVGQSLLTHPAVQGVAFTGSTQTGRSIQKTASDRMIPVQAEMGGKNAALIWDEDSIDESIEAVVGAAFACSGQRCTAISRIVVSADIFEDVQDALLQRIRKLRVGNGLDNGTTMGPLVDESQVKKVEAAVQNAVSEGATILTGGDRMRPDGYENGYFYSPTVIGDTDGTMSIVKEEVFGPVVTLESASSFSDAVESINNTEYGLSASLFCQDFNLIDLFINEVECGMIHINQGTAPESHMPFGGLKGSQFGPPSVGSETKEFYTAVKTVYLSPAS